MNIFTMLFVKDYLTLGRKRKEANDVSLRSFRFHSFVLFEEVRRAIRLRTARHYQQIDEQLTRTSNDLDKSSYLRSSFFTTGQYFQEMKSHLMEHVSIIFSALRNESS